MSSIQEDGVWLYSPKQVRKTDPKKWVFKPLHKWKGGQLALKIIHELQDRTPAQQTALFPCALSEVIVNNTIREVSAELGWDKELRFRSHSLRHGGIQHLIDSMGEKPDIDTIGEWLLMSRPSVLHYATPNHLRKGPLLVDDSDFSKAKRGSQETLMKQARKASPKEQEMDEQEDSSKAESYLKEYINGFFEGRMSHPKGRPSIDWPNLFANADKGQYEGDLEQKYTHEELYYTLIAMNERNQLDTELASPPEHHSAEARTDAWGIDKPGEPHLFYQFKTEHPEEFWGIDHSALVAEPHSTWLDLEVSEKVEESKTEDEDWLLEKHYKEILSELYSFHTDIPYP